MLVKADTYQFDTIGEVERTAFSIKANGKAFRILIDGLYADKHTSIARELTANAWDSHVVAKQDKPFFVHSPTELRPEFYVRDYGIGMDHDKVTFLYTTLFESDKDQTNDQVGAKGLGSKTPFAYTDQFYLSCYDGESVRHYSAAIGSTGEPQLVMLGQEPCDEERGVRVGFAVDAGDFEKFEKAIAQVALGHDPAFHSNLKITDNMGVETLAGAGWQRYKGGDLLATWNVRQGCVIYPLSSTSGLTLPAENSNHKWLLECPIGTIDVVTSREAIEYTSDVVAYLQERLESLKAEVREQVWAKIKDTPSVAAFFAGLKDLAPAFLDQSTFRHPVTNATSTTWTLNQGRPLGCVYTAHYDIGNKRWLYSVQEQVEVSKFLPKVIHRLTTPLECILDTPAQRAKNPVSDEKGFSRSERRRLARLARAYCADQGIAILTIALGLGEVQDDHWAAYLPHTEIVDLTFDQLRMVIPALPLDRQRSLQPAMRGLNKVISASRNEPVIALEPTPGEACWVQSDFFRRRPEYTIAFVKRFGFPELYIASPTAEERIAAAGVPHIREAIESKLPKGTSWIDWCKLLDTALSSHGIINGVRDKLWKNDKPSFRKIAGMDGLFGELYTLSEPYLKAKVHALDHYDREVVTMLNGTSYGGTTIGGSPTDPAVANLISISNKVDGLKGVHPAYLMYEALNTFGGKKEQRAVTLDAFLQVSALFPDTVKFSKDTL